MSSNSGNYTEILTSIEFGNVFKIVFNRPEKLNAVTRKMYTEIISALEQADNNPDIIFCCFTGNGNFFSSGNDLTNYTNSSSNEEPEEMIKNGLKLVETFINAFINFSKPLVALVNGPAIGIAFTILGIFDLVIASEKATFYAPFTQIGLCPEGCSSYTFPRLMGHTKACDVLLFNRKLNAKEAFERNLVAEILPHNNLSTVFDKKIELLSKINPKSLLASKNILRNSERDALIKVNRKEMELLTERLISGDFMESVMAFMSKKPKL